MLRTAVPPPPPVDDPLRGPVRDQRRAAEWQRAVDRASGSYAACSELAGPLDPPGAPGTPVRFRSALRRSQRVVLSLLIVVNGTAALTFIGWLLLPSHVPGPALADVGGLPLALARVGYCLVVLVEVVRFMQNAALWVFALRVRDPVPVHPPSGLRVAMLTTIVPAKEPLEVVERTLAAMVRVRHDGILDVWILDEGDDPRVRAMARRMGVRHFTRRGRPEYNRDEGAFRRGTKAGNHNAWRADHEHRYDVVAQMDPDHVPVASFLERTLGYFRDDDVAFVVAPQVYGNMYTGWVSHGASMQQYLFSGVVERGGNGLGAPLLIGTNHLYRPAAWRQIGGYQDSIIEDHLTSMVVQATTNPATGHRWKGVYTPDVIAIGEGPTTWTDYFNQQKRWAYGVWEIMLRRPAATRRLSRTQRLCYGLVQSYYPGAAVMLVAGNLATALYLTYGVSNAVIDGSTWLALWGAGMASFLLLWWWLRRLNLAGHERRETGLTGMVLALFAAPVYVSAATAALLRRRLGYAVTAKGRLRSSDSARTFRLHVCWGVTGVALLVVSTTMGRDARAPQVWTSLTAFAGLSPPLIASAAWLWARTWRGGLRVTTVDGPDRSPGVDP